MTIEDIASAIKLLRKEPWKTIENDVCKLEVSDAGVETIQLKRLGKELIDNWMKDTHNKNKGTISEFFGIQVVISNDVEGLK